MPIDKLLPTSVSADADGKEEHFIPFRDPKIEHSSSSSTHAKRAVLPFRPKYTVVLPSICSVKKDYRSSRINNFAPVIICHLNQNSYGAISKFVDITQGVALG